MCARGYGIVQYSICTCIGACMQGDASDQFLYSCLFKQNLIGKVKCSYSGIYGIYVCIAIATYVCHIPNSC